jgi:hypothetical protein
VNDTTDQGTFVQHVTDAAHQLWLMRPWEYDQALAADNWATFYAVDADVFSAYGSPMSEARRERGRPGYAEVFADDPEPLSFSLAHRLMDHIFFGLQPSLPLLVIPPIDSEFGTILNALTARLGREPAPMAIDDEVIAEQVQIMVNFIGKEIPADVLSRFTALAAFTGNSPQTKYQRLTHLLELRRVLPSTQVGPADGFPSELVKVLNASWSLEDSLEYADLSGKWLAQLNQHGPLESTRVRKRDSSILDAYALARLELLNNRLAPNKIRIVYVTGAVHLIRAAAEERRETGSLKPDDFYTRYVRHPRYFLASPEVVAASPHVVGLSMPLSETGVGSSEFYEWVVTFLADCKIPSGAGERFKMDEGLLSAARKAFESYPKLGEDLRTRWQGYLKELAASYKAPGEVLGLIVQDLVRTSETRAIRGWQEVRERIDDQIEAAKDKTWDACFRSATKVGLFVAYADPGADREPSRLVPPLRFDLWPKTEIFINSLSAWSRPDPVQAGQYQAAIDEVEVETGRDDFPYAYYLAHAALFAARGDWRVGAILAIRALLKVKSPSPAPGTLTHGREASYLAAYCLRHRARNDADLFEAQAYLDRAISIYAAEIAVKPELRTLPQRFAAEKLAFKMTELFRRQFSEKLSDDTPVATSPVEWAGLRANFIALEAEVAETISARSLSAADAGDYELCAARLVSRLNANIMMSSIMMLSLDDAIFVAAGEKLNRFIAVSPSNRSYYLSTLDMIWRAVRSGEKISRRKVWNHFSDEQIAYHSVLPYDRKRYAFMKAVMDRYLQ